nr:ORF39; putative [Synechococcus sp.]prf//1410329B ORF 39 [Synechococcus sp.]
MVYRSPISGGVVRVVFHSIHLPSQLAPSIFPAGKYRGYI